MAKKQIYQFSQTSAELQQRLDHPLWQVYDARARLYRYFADKRHYDEATALLEQGLSLTPELLLAQQHAITAPAPYTVSIKNYRSSLAVLAGTTGVYLDYEFQTIDGNGVMLEEAVDVIYTFTNNGVSEQTGGTYYGGTKVHFLIDKFIKPGINSVTIIATGRTSLVMSSPVVITVNVVAIGIKSSFSVAKSQPLLDTGLVNMLVTFHTWGAYDKYVEFFIDSESVSQMTQYISAANDMNEDNAVARNADFSLPLSPGKHTLQMRTRVTVNDADFYTDTLYYEFVVTGREQTAVMLAQRIPSGSLISPSTPLVLKAEQYKAFSATWGYYTSRVSGHTATVQWLLRSQGGDDITISTQDATVVDATNDTLPDPIEFVPEYYGDFDLVAIVGGDVIGSYPINIVRNQDGIAEYSNGLRLRLSAMGRSNAEPADLRSRWEANGFKTTFSGVEWNTVSGWQRGALVLRDGATAVVDIRPLVAPQSTGATIEVTFETFAVNDDSAPLIYCGTSAGGGSFAICGKKAFIRSNDGSRVETQFQSGNVITMALVINASSISGITSEGDLMFIQTDGIRERCEDYSGATDYFGSADVLHLGDPEGRAGIRIRNIRIYDRAIGRNDEANNFILGSGSISQLLEDNDILTNGIIDVDKLTSKYDTIAITAGIDKFFSSTSKDKIYGDVWRKNPQDQRDNFEAVGAEISHPGQSTLGFSKPQLRINLNEKKSCVLYDYEGNMLSKGYYPISYGAIPEKKVRLNPNFVDSSCANALGFFNMVNDIYYSTQVGNEFVLRNAAQRFAAEDYPRLMGEPFPYRIQSCPRAVPVVLIWRPDEKTEWSFLSVFTMLDEKKSPRKFGQRSIYDKRLPNGKLDPFDTYDGEKGTRIWDNNLCFQYEIQDNGEQLALFRDLTHFWSSDGLINEQVFEREVCRGQNSDDCTYEDLRSADELFFRLASFIYEHRDDQAGFDAHWLEYLDPWKTAAYYVLMMKLGMVDSSVRNMDLRTDDGDIWYPIWWDPDVQKGKRNDGPLVYEPGIDRESRDPNNPNTYAFAGHDSALLNLLEGCREFIQNYVPRINTAMYSGGADEGGEAKGLSVRTMMDYYRRGTGYYCIRAYNESIQEKYINDFPSKDYLAFNCGNAEQHDQRWVAASFQYWDARWASGAYASKSIYMRINGAFGRYSEKAKDNGGYGLRAYFRSAHEQYYMWAQTNIEYRQLDEPIHAMSGEAFTIELGAQDSGKLQDFGYNNPFVMFGCQSLMEADFHEFAPYFSAAVQFTGLYDADLGSNVRRLIIGVSKADMARGVFNTDATVSFTDLDKLTTLEYLDIQGLRGVMAISGEVMARLDALRDFRAAGSGLTVFNPASGQRFARVELPDTCRSLLMTECSWDDLVFYRPDGNTPHTTVPTTLEAVYFYNMASADRQRRFVMEWLQQVEAEGASFDVRRLTLTNIVWDDVPIADMLRIGRIPAEQRSLSGTITIGEILTAEQYSLMVEMFGEHVFTHGSALVINAKSSFVIGGPTRLRRDDFAQITGVSFPISDRQPRVEFEIIGGAEITDVDGNRFSRLNGCAINTRTGLLTTEEGAWPVGTITVRGIDMDTDANSTLTITIEPRVYPTSVVIAGDDQIITTGGYDYAPFFTPTDFDGTQRSFAWTLTGNPEGISRYSDSATSFKLLVEISPADEITLTIGYTASFANGGTVSASKQVLVMTESVILRQTEKPVIVNAMYDEGYCQSAWRMTNVEARAPLALPAALTANPAVEPFPEIRYFKSLLAIDLHGSTHVGDEGPLDLTALTKLKTIDLRDTPASIKL